jgi:hypothetical protein
MELTGWIKSHRKIIETSWFKKPAVAHLAIYLLHRAYWKTGKIIWLGKERELKPGQLYTGRLIISTETGLSHQQVRTSLKILSNTGFLTNETTNKGSVITIINYEYYQSLEQERPAEQPASNQQATSKQPASNQQVTTDEEVKKLRSKEKTLKPLCEKNSHDERFDLFWSQYPRHVNKTKAMTSFRRMVNGNFDAIMAALAKQKISDQWTRDDGKYIPHPTTWLNGKRWEDDLPEKENYRGNLNETQKAVLEAKRRREEKENGNSGNGGKNDFPVIGNTTGQKIITGSN